MKLPNANLASVERGKITEYLLDRGHPDNGGKADFFTGLGFSSAEWEIMAEALRQLAMGFPMVQSMESAHGKKYIVDGQVETPSGKTRGVRTVWIIDRGKITARLVTAYPHEE